MDHLALGFQSQRAPTAGHFVRLSTRTLEKYRYKGSAIVEIVLNPDGPLWVVIADLARTSGFNDTLDRARTTAEMTHFGMETGFVIIGGNCRRPTPPRQPSSRLATAAIRRRPCRVAGAGYQRCAAFQ
jgi:hypothetical protein